MICIITEEIIYILDTNYIYVLYTIKYRKWPMEKNLKSKSRTSGNTELLHVGPLFLNPFLDSARC